MKQLLTACLLVALISACNGPKEIAIDAPERSFILGSGGGVTGAYDTYKIFNTGKVEKQNSDLVTFSFLKTLPTDSVQVGFQILDALEIEEYSFDHPGNMTYFIVLENSTGSNAINWGGSNHPIRQDIDDFFKRIRTMVRAEYN